MWSPIDVFLCAQWGVTAESKPRQGAWGQWSRQSCCCAVINGSLSVSDWGERDTQDIWGNARLVETQEQTIFLSVSQVQWLLPPTVFAYLYLLPVNTTQPASPQQEIHLVIKGILRWDFGLFTSWTHQKTVIHAPEMSNLTQCNSLWATRCLCVFQKLAEILFCAVF